MSKSIWIFYFSFLFLYRKSFFACVEIFFSFTNKKILFSSSIVKQEITICKMPHLPQPFSKENQSHGAKAIGLWNYLVYSCNLTWVMSYFSLYYCLQNRYSGPITAVLRWGPLTGHCHVTPQQFCSSLCSSLHSSVQCTR